MQVALRGLGFQMPDSGGGNGGGFFSSLFDIFGSVAEAAPQFLPAFQQSDPRQGSFKLSAAPQRPLPATQAAQPSASDNSPMLWLAIAFLAGLVIAKG